MNDARNPVGPISSAERFVGLDLLRGIAVLGILIMNIQSFSMIGSAYTNPAAFGDLSGANWWAWLLSHLFADQKFMTLFSVMFGAGVVMMSERASAKDIKPAGLHYRRTLWLLVIGLAHAYMLWYGDILVAYALCSIIVYWFRNAAPKRLFVGGLIVFSVSSLINLFFGLSMASWPAESIDGLSLSWAPPQEVIDAEVAAYRGGWLDQMVFRVPTAIMIQTVVFLLIFLWRAGGLMLVGMALYKWGVLTGKKSVQFYHRLALYGIALGFPIVAYGAFRNVQADFVAEYSMFTGGLFNYWGSLIVAGGYVGIIMSLFKRFDGAAWISRMAGVGRMALTNYLFSTIICTTIFYGHGFGLYGTVSRTGQLLIVPGVWILLLLGTHWWLQRYQYGPFEWLWRSLTYWKKQPLRIQPVD